MAGSVLVIGGGIAGIQAALNLADSGIDEDKCTGCEDCVRSCPVKVSNEYNLGLDKRKAIYIPFPQSVPRIATIDAVHCMHFTRGKCGVCKMKCQRGAVDFDQEDKILDLEVGSIVVATGFNIYDPRGLTEYGYGVYPDVVTSMEFERILCASGPTAGKIKRPSDGKVPDRIVFIQCVGSRDPARAQSYCSSVCCMHATKEAILVKEHEEHIQTFILYTDLRVAGKGFYEYAERGKREYGISYIRAKPGRIVQDKKTGNLDVWYEDTEMKGVKKIEAGMVVLSTNLMPSKGASEVAKVLDVELDENGFFQSPDPLLRPVDTTRPGVFVTGYCVSPKDIPESVAQAGAAALRAANIVAGVSAS